MYIVLLYYCVYRVHCAVSYFCIILKNVLLDILFKIYKIKIVYLKV